MGFRFLEGRHSDAQARSAQVGFVISQLHETSGSTESLLMLISGGLIRTIS